MNLQQCGIWKLPKKLISAECRYDGGTQTKELMQYGSAKHSCMIQTISENC